MDASRHIVFACAAILFGWAADAQTTNFTPHAPPRSYDTLVQMHHVALAFSAVKKDADWHLFVPQTGGGFSVPDMQSPQAFVAQPLQPRAREMQKTDDGKRPDVRTIIAGPDEDRSIAAGWSGFARDVMMQRSSARDAKLPEKNDSQGADLGNSDSGEAGIAAFRASHDHSQDAMGNAGAIDAAVARDGSFLSQSPADLNNGQIGNDAFSASAFDASAKVSVHPAGMADAISGGELRALPQQQGGEALAVQFGDSQFASPWNAGGSAAQPSAFGGGAQFFTSQQNTPSSPSLFSQGGGSIFTHDDAPRAFSPIATPAAAGDFKKPSTLPW
jgi:hypothetical protein